jgi:hypothetical protein
MVKDSQLAAACDAGSKPFQLHSTALLNMNQLQALTSPTKMCGAADVLTIAVQLHGMRSPTYYTSCSATC